MVDMLLYLGKIKVVRETMQQYNQLLYSFFEICPLFGFRSYNQCLIIEGLYHACP